MEKLIVSIIIGLIAGLVDIFPMFIQKLSKRSIISAFIHYLLVSIVIINIDLPGIVWWLKGGIISFALSIPVVIIISDNDKKVIPIILSMSIILGSLIGIAGQLVR